MKFFTSDLHIGHKNIITYADRPFTRADGQPDTDLMEETLLANISSVVKPGDELYILGDIALNGDKAYNFLTRLPTKQIFIVWGNHDPGRKEKQKRDKLKSLAVRSGDIMETKLHDGTKVIMCHYPMLRWNHSHHGSVMLHGHTHGDLKYPYPMRIMDVGMDSEIQIGAFSHPKYFPVSEDEIIHFAKELPPIYHHNRHPSQTSKESTHDNP